jgi:hypothetical protein
MESTIYTVNGKEFELQHHGVKGMKWGKRKKYVTVRQGMKNAQAAGREAWQKNTTENGGKLVGKDKNVAVYKNPVAMRRGRAAAQTARNDAIKESIKNDKAANKAERQRAKAEKKQSNKSAEGANAMKTAVSKLLGSEMAKRGKAALDVLQNGDKDWMGNSITADDNVTEARNRGKAALERLLYSEKQIENKKFFGEYNPFG